MPQTFVDINYILNYIELKLLQPPKDSVHFLNSLLCLLILFVLPVNFMVSGICN